MERSPVVERLFRPLAGQRGGEPAALRGQDNAPLEVYLRPTPSRRSTATSLAGRVLDGDTLSTAPDGALSDEQPEDALPALKPEVPASLRRPTAPEPERPGLRQSPQNLDRPPVQTPVEQRDRPRPPEREAEAEASQDHQILPATSEPVTRLDRRAEAPRRQPPMPLAPENEPPDATGALRERSEGQPQPVEPTLRSEPVRPAANPSVPEPPQVLRAADPASPQALASEALTERRAVEPMAREESGMQPADPAENRQPATVEIRPVGPEPAAPPIAAATSEAPQADSESPSLEPQHRASPPVPEPQMPARVTLAVPAADQMIERRDSQPAPPQPSITLSIGRIELVTRRPPSPRLRTTRPRGHQIDPGLAFFRRG